MTFKFQNLKIEKTGNSILNDPLSTPHHKSKPIEESLFDRLG